MMEEDEKQEELDQVARWLQAEGAAPDAPMKEQLCVLWRSLQHRESRLVTMTHDLETLRSRHSVEMTEVQRSLEQIRTLTEEKHVLAQEIQEENDQLRVQLHRLLLQQDAQINEVAEMLYQEGLSEVIHSNPSEQVAYLLAERATLLERDEGPEGPMSHRDTLFASQGETEDTSDQSLHQGAPHRGQSPWRRLFGLRKAAQSKHTFIPIESRQQSGQVLSVERECARLERDLEEGSRRLAMAHKEIRRLTDELESARLTQSAYEPELQGAQQEVEQLRQEVEKLKKSDVVELRKAKELNDRLDQEIRALRTRVRSIDAERRSLQEKVQSLEKGVDRLGTDLQDQQQKPTQQVLTVQIQGQQATELVKIHAELEEEQQRSRELRERLAQSSQDAHNNNNNNQRLKDQLGTERTRLAAMETEIQALKQELKASELQLHQERSCSVESTCLEGDNRNCLAALTNQAKEHKIQRRLWEQRELDLQQEVSSLKETEASLNLSHSELSHRARALQTQLEKLQSTASHAQKVSLDDQEVTKRLLASEDEREELKEELCEALKSLDAERSKYHRKSEQHKGKLHRARQRIGEETKWRDEKIHGLEDELSLSVHSSAKEKQLCVAMNEENEKLLLEKRTLLKQLNEEEETKNTSVLVASLSKRRVEFLEEENRKLEDRMLQLSNQLASLERTLRNVQSLHCAEELRKMANPASVFLTSSPLQTPRTSAAMPGSSDMRGLLDVIQRSEDTASPHSTLTTSLSRPTEMGYLNLTSPQSTSDCMAPSDSLSSTDSDEAL